MIRPITQRLIEGIKLDLMPDWTVCVDFGLDRDDPTTKFGALQWAYRRDLVTDGELDMALGEGGALTEIANRVSPQDGINPYACTIVTAYDLLLPEEDRDVQL